MGSGRAGLYTSNATVADPQTASARVSQEADGSIRASWDHAFPGGGTGLLYAKVRPSGTEWLLCFWDTASA